MTTSTSFPTSGAMIDVEGVSKSFGGTEAFVSVKLEGPGGHRAGVARPNGAGKTTLVSLRNLGVYVDPQHAGLAAGLRQSPAHRPSRQHRASSPKAAPSTPNLFWTVRWSIAILAVFAPWQSVATGRASTQRHPLPPKPREQMP